MKPDDDWPGRHHVEAAEGWLALGDWQEAKAELDLLGPAGRDHPEALRARADVFEVAGRWNAQTVVLEKLTHLEPDEIDHWLRLNAAQLLAGQPREALARLETILERHPDHPGLLFKLAVTQAALGAIRSAGRTLTKLFTLEHHKYARTYVPLALQWNELAPLHDQLRDMQEMLDARQEDEGP